MLVFFTAVVYHPPPATRDRHGPISGVLGRRHKPEARDLASSPHRHALGTANARPIE
jgi:hypothetical protein